MPGLIKKLGKSSDQPLVELLPHKKAWLIASFYVILIT